MKNTIRKKVIRKAPLKLQPSWYIGVLLVLSVIGLFNFGYASAKLAEKIWYVFENFDSYWLIIEVSIYSTFLGFISFGAWNMTVVLGKCRPILEERWFGDL
jgi:ABC-type transport system involved in cytochrome c biogenesis permease subunit